MRRQGGLQVDKIVELANGDLAKVLEMTDEFVILDANNMLAGAERFLEVAVVGIERPPAADCCQDALSYEL